MRNHPPTPTSNPNTLPSEKQLARELSALPSWEEYRIPVNGDATRIRAFPQRQEHLMWYVRELLPDRLLPKKDEGYEEWWKRMRYDPFVKAFRDAERNLPVSVDYVKNCGNGAERVVLRRWLLQNTEVVVRERTAAVEADAKAAYDLMSEKEVEVERLKREKEAVELRVLELEEELRKRDAPVEKVRAPKTDAHASFEINNFVHAQRKEDPKIPLGTLQSLVEEKWGVSLPTKNISSRLGRMKRLARERGEE